MARQASAERPSASARASARIEFEIQRCARVLRHSAGQLVPDRPDEIGQTRAQRDVRFALLESGGQIDFRQRRAARRPLRLRRVDAQPFEPYVLAAPLRRRLHLVAQAVPIGDEPRMQARRSRQDDAHSEKATCRHGRMRPKLRLDRAKQAGLVIVRRGVDEHLRPTGAVRHNAPHLGDGPVRDLDDHRALLAAFSDAAALQIAGVDDPGILRDDFESVDVAERPIVVAARREIGDRARRVVLVAGAAASRVQRRQC